MSLDESKKKVSAALALLSESQTSIATMHSVSTILKGVHPKIDSVLAVCETHLATLEKIEHGDFIELSVERLPDTTEDEKKRKKVLMLFIRSFGELKGEVARVQAEFTQLENGQASQGVSMWGRIFSVARGPLALVTIVAVGLTVLGATSVTLTIHNVGCGTMHAQSGMPFSIPGLSLPSEPIKSGGFAVAIVPPLSLSIDGTESGKLVMSSLGLHMSFQLGGSVKNVTLDGVSLLGKKSDVRLSEKDTHELSLICSS